MFILVLALTPVVGAYAQSRPGYVYDFADILFSSEIQAIESLSAQVDAATSAEIVVVTLPDLEEYGGDISMARLEYFNEIALEGVNNGVLIIVAMEERAWGIEVGYGVEGDLTDSESGRIGREIIVPNFQEEDYYYGLFIAVAAVADELGYNLTEFDETFGSDVLDDPDVWDILVEDDPWYFFYWLLGSEGGIYAIILVRILIICGFFQVTSFCPGLRKIHHQTRQHLRFNRLITHSATAFHNLKRPFFPFFTLRPIAYTVNSHPTDPTETS